MPIAKYVASFKLKLVDRPESLKNRMSLSILPQSRFYSQYGTCCHQVNPIDGNQLG